MCLPSRSPEFDSRMMQSWETWIYDTVAEWLRREIRNLLEFLRAGSSPVGVDGRGFNSGVGCSLCMRDVGGSIPPISICIIRMVAGSNPAGCFTGIYSSVVERSIAEQNALFDFYSHQFQ